MTIKKEYTEEEIEEAALKATDNFGPPTDMFHPEYGWIMRDGVTTPEGIEFWEDIRLEREKLKIGNC